MVTAGKTDPRILGPDTFVEEIMAREGMPVRPPTLTSVVSKE